MDQLYTYEILQELKKFDCQDFIIQILWPLFTSLIGVLTAYLIFRNQIAIVNQEKTHKFKMVGTIVNSVNSAAIKELGEWRKEIQKMHDNSNLENHNKNPILIIQNSLFNPIIELKFNTIYELFSNYIIIDHIKLLHYWEHISSISKQMEKFGDFQISIKSDIQFQSEKLNSTTKQLWTLIKTAPEDLKRDSYAIFNAFENNQKTNKNTANFNTFYNDMYECLRPYESDLNNYEIIQLVYDGLQIIADFENIFKNFQITCVDYFVLIESAIGSINSIQIEIKKHNI